jgi:hypothetical protein
LVRESSFVTSACAPSNIEFGSIGTYNLPGLVNGEGVISDF